MTLITILLNTSLFILPQLQESPFATQNNNSNNWYGALVKHVIVKPSKTNNSWNTYGNRWYFKILYLFTSLLHCEHFAEFQFALNGSHQDKLRDCVDPINGSLPLFCFHRLDCSKVKNYCWWYYIIPNRMKISTCFLIYSPPLYFISWCFLFFQVFQHKCMIHHFSCGILLHLTTKTTLTWFRYMYIYIRRS